MKHKKPNPTKEQVASKEENVGKPVKTSPDFLCGK